MTTETFVSSAARTRTLSPWTHYALATLGALALLIFYRMAWRETWTGYSDFDQVYLAGAAWRHSLVPYGDVQPAFRIPNGPPSSILINYYYLPLCSMLAAPLSLLPFPLAATAWKFGVFTLLFAGVWQFSRLVLPKWPSSVRLFAVGVTALSGSVRWNLVQLQPTALIVALLLFFVGAVIRKRWAGSVLLGILISVKASYLLPVVGLLAFCRQWKPLGALMAAMALLNLIALMPTGPGATLSRYRDSMQHVEDPGHMNYPSALDFLTPYLANDTSSPLAPLAPKGREPGHWSGEQIHATFLFSAWTRSVAQAKLLSLAFAVMTLGMLAWLWKQTARTGLIDDPAFLSLLFVTLNTLGLLLVYHQRYDALALVPAAFVALAALERRPRDSAAWTAFGASFLFAYLLTGSLLDKWHIRLVVPHGWLVLVPLCAYLTLTVFLALLTLLWRSVREALAPDTAIVRVASPKILTN